ncbi:unnamed protein product [Effrenium voratum]|uniref:DUF202 domain-containing protein n=1 Tax=Effrenium voratum TaxID=2562239 RepID=A0AA36NDA7_9DINO|nr:unnamed protein product [Effrenium voratum]CAJ1443346.1 unnamed protein product [Effrenium voratum]
MSQDRPLLTVEDVEAGEPQSLSVAGRKLQRQCSKAMLRYGLSSQVKNEGSTARDHLANERTFLAWLRTGLSLTGAGFGIVKFLPGVFTNLILGFTLIGVGISVLVFGASRYYDVMHSLERGEFAIDTGGVLLVVGCAGILVVLVVLLGLGHMFLHPEELARLG